MGRLVMHEEKMELKTDRPNNMPKSENIDKIVEELQRMVGFRKVVLWPEVPPGASLNALLQAYKEAGLRLKDKYLPANVDYAVNRIYGELNSEVF